MKSVLGCIDSLEDGETHRSVEAFGADTELATQGAQEVATA